jgi:hypothetical protein
VNAEMAKIEIFFSEDVFSLSTDETGIFLKNNSKISHVATFTIKNQINTQLQTKKYINLLSAKLERLAIIESKSLFCSVLWYINGDGNLEEL